MNSYDRTQWHADRHIKRATAWGDAGCGLAALAILVIVAGAIFVLIKLANATS